jgi:hypothetical protein
LAIRQEKFIRDLNNALLRIENKVYGVCRVTGKLINKERLKLQSLIEIFSIFPVVAGQAVYFRKRMFVSFVR